MRDQLASSTPCEVVPLHLCLTYRFQMKIVYWKLPLQNKIVSAGIFAFHKITSSMTRTNSSANANSVMIWWKHRIERFSAILLMNLIACQSRILRSQLKSFSTSFHPTSGPVLPELPMITTIGSRVLVL